MLAASDHRRTELQIYLAGLSSMQKGFTRAIFQGVCNRPEGAVAR